MNTEIKLSTGGECSAPGCDRAAFGGSVTCRYHSILRMASRLTAEELDSLRGDLVDMTVLSDEERARERRDVHLRDLKRYVGYVIEAEEKAREFGAGEAEIAKLKGSDAQRRVAEQAETAERVVNAFKAAIADLGLSNWRRDQAIRAFLAGFPH